MPEQQPLPVNESNQNFTKVCVLMNRVHGVEMCTVEKTDPKCESKNDKKNTFNNTYTLGQLYNNSLFIKY